MTRVVDGSAWWRVLALREAALDAGRLWAAECREGRGEVEWNRMRSALAEYLEALAEVGKKAAPAPPRTGEEFAPHVGYIADNGEFFGPGPGPYREQVNLTEYR